MKKYLTIVASWLDRPFPYSETATAKIRIAVLFGLFVFLFLAFFQPFGIEDIEGEKYLYLSGFGIVTFTAMMITFFVLPLIFTSFFNLDNWRVKNHILFTLSNVLLIALFNWLYNNQAGVKTSEYNDLPSFLVITAGVGVIPVVILTMYIERRLLKMHNEVALDVSNQIEKQRGESINEDSIILVSENSNESLQLPQSQLICIGSEGNYSKVYFRDDGKVEERMMRIPLKKLEAELGKYKKIIRCHRSYIINLQQIEYVSGNARSYKLHMVELDFTIPVSRSFPKTIIEQLVIV